MEDIVPKIYAHIKTTYDKEVSSNEIIKNINNLIKSNKASYSDLYDFANELGKCLEKSFKFNISKGILPDDTMYYNIATRLIEPMVFKNYQYMVNRCVTVQSSLNKRAEIGLNAIQPDYNEEKTKGIVNYISAGNYFDREKSFLDSLSTNTRSIVDDSVKGNADFHYKSGLNPKIIRRVSGECCKWCSSIAGVYDYKTVRDTGNDVFRRHANCSCIVSYDPGDGSKQVTDVWTKKIRYQSKFEEVKKNLEATKTK